MQFTITDLCLRSDTDFPLLQRRTDACARLGRSYEIPCKLPDICTPRNVCIGFYRRGEQYLLYIRPQVCYSGTSKVAAAIFSSGICSFPSFSTLAGYLHQLGRELNVPQEGIQSSSLFYQIKTSLEQHILGQEQAVESTAFRLSNHICKTQPCRPLSLVLYGATGVGKSELAKSIAPVLQALQPPRQWRTAWTELNTYTQPHTVSRLIGSPPGYVGYDDSPVLECVRENPHTVFIFDELDKAHPEVLKLFMSILDEGRCTARRADDHGQRELDFRGCVFLFTTNMDLSITQKQPLGFSIEPSTAAVPPPQPASLLHRLFIHDETARLAMIRAGIPPEIVCRFTGLIGFQPLDELSRSQITIKQIIALGREFGLNIVSVSHETAAALTPHDAVSIRSAPTVLEGVLTPVFARHISHCSTRDLHLSGTAECIILTPADRHI